MDKQYQNESIDRHSFGLLLTDDKMAGSLTPQMKDFKAGSKQKPHMIEIEEEKSLDMAENDEIPLTSRSAQLFPGQNLRNTVNSRSRKKSSAQQPLVRKRSMISDLYHSESNQEFVFENINHRDLGGLTASHLDIMGTNTLDSMQHDINTTKWTPNSSKINCLICNSKFGFFKRKHHCR
jgi:hypothetical protein